MASLQSTERLEGWWEVVVPRANRIYFSVILAASLGVLALSRVASRFVPCAEYVEIDWLLVALLSMTAVGVLNVMFAFVPLLERHLPERAVPLLRNFLVVVLPFAGLIAIVWIAVGAFVPALFNDSELLCD